jgi:hypothetical protein
MRILSLFLFMVLMNALFGQQECNNVLDKVDVFHSSSFAYKVSVEVNVKGETGFDNYNYYQFENGHQVYYPSRAFTHLILRDTSIRIDEFNKRIIVDNTSESSPSSMRLLPDQLVIEDNPNWKVDNGSCVLKRTENLGEWTKMLVKVNLNNGSIETIVYEKEDRSVVVKYNELLPSSDKRILIKDYIKLSEETIVPSKNYIDYDVFNALY